ncbi:hypothetical protein F4819DRAFT_455470 [Hypoxylon fuscum]|nr:hypothetical protein F4819DRAFT_455470 [Hypoxylon fuscum]
MRNDGMPSVSIFVFLTLLRPGLFTGVSSTYIISMVQVSSSQGNPQAKACAHVILIGFHTTRLQSRKNKLHLSGMRRRFYGNKHARHTRNGMDNKELRGGCMPHV